MIKTVLVLTALAAPAAVAQEWSADVNLAAKHVNATESFNEINPGLGVSVSWGEQWRASLSGGVYLNSYSDWSGYALVGLDTRLVDMPAFDLYGGVWAGFAQYGNLVGYADRNGIPRIGDYIMVAGVSASVKFEAVEVVVRYLPAGDKMDGVAGLSLRFLIGQHTSWPAF